MGSVRKVEMKMEEKIELEGVVMKEELESHLQGIHEEQAHLEPSLKLALPPVLHGRGGLWRLALGWFQHSALEGSGGLVRLFSPAKPGAERWEFESLEARQVGRTLGRDVEWR